jgi:hypothetical protein
MLRIHIKGRDLDLHPNFLQEDFFGDPDDLQEFLDNLHEDECGIIAQHGKNIDALRAIKQRADHDVENTSKALALEG